MAISYLSGGRIQGLSSDTKPTNVPLQSLFEETDTGKFFTHLYASGFASAPSWVEMGTGGEIALNTALNSTLISGGNGVSGGVGNYNIQTSTETFSGGTWTAGADMSTNRTIHAGGGTSLNAFVAAGETSSGGSGWNNGVTCEEYYDNSGTMAWRAGGDYPYVQYYINGAGQQTNAIAGGGNGTHSKTTHSHKYNGTAWSAISAAGSSTIGYGAYAATMGGNFDDAIYFGGYASSITGETETWDGSTWTGSGTMTARYNAGGDGNSTNAIVYSGTGTAVCQKFTSGTWSSSIGNASGGERSGGFAGGNATQAICGFGNQSGTRIATAEIWNGSSFQSSGTGIVGRQHVMGGSAS